MRNYKNNIILHVRNITLYLENIKRYLTDKAKIITLVSIIIMLSFVNITPTSALSYSSSVGIGFTFNPTLSISLSSSDLVINDLVPGNTLDSNVINVSVASNASYGYTLSAIVNGNNSNLTHNNGANIFSSIATNADLSDLKDSEDTNIWGYSYKDNTVVSPAWSNYNGLSSSVSKTLLDTNTNNTETGIDSIDFKIAAKASETQPSGTYTGVINFTAVSNVAPMSLLDSFIASGAKQLNGYYKMQDMTHDICEAVDVEESELQLIDVRDNKIYWIAKLKDGNCWMTQNLDLDLDSNRTYTHWDTDLGWNNPNNLDTNATWKPIRSAIDFTIGSSVSGWVDSYTEPSSANPGNVYFYTSNSDANDVQYNSLQECINAGHDDCAHYHIGNYYNWSSMVASNDTSSLTSGEAPNSICPKGWRLPKRTSIQNFQSLINIYKVNSTNALNLRQKPIYFTRSGYIINTTNGSSVNLPRYVSYYWTDTTFQETQAYNLYFRTNLLNASSHYTKGCGFSVRCLVR